MSAPIDVFNKTVNCCDNKDLAVAFCFDLCPAPEEDIKDFIKKYALRCNSCGVEVDRIDGYDGLVNRWNNANNPS